MIKSTSASPGSAGFQPASKKSGSAGYQPASKKSGSAGYQPASSLFAFTVLSLSQLLFAPTQASDQVLPKTKSLSPSAARIISIAPSNTELVYSLNAAKQLVAVSDICDFPLEARSKPKVGNLSSLKMEKIASLKPDVVLLVSGQEALSNSLKKHGFRVLLLDNSSITKIGKNLLDISKECHKESEANQLSLAFEKSLRELKTLTQQDKQQSRVFVCVWPQPLMSAGKYSFINEGVTVAGGINCTGEMPQAYPRVNQEKLILLQPDMILVPQEQARDKFWTRSPWTSLKAVKENRVYVLPQHETDCLTRPTLRFIDALYWLAIKLHPKLKTQIDNWHSGSLKQLSAIH